MQVCGASREPVQQLIKRIHMKHGTNIHVPFLNIAYSEVLSQHLSPCFKPNVNTYSYSTTLEKHNTFRSFRVTQICKDRGVACDDVTDDYYYIIMFLSLRVHCWMFYCIHKKAQQEIASSPGRFFANITAGEKYGLVLIVCTCAPFQLKSH